jgi:hypothetical protein
VGDVVVRYRLIYTICYDGVPRRKIGVRINKESEREKETKIKNKNNSNSKK